MIRNTDTCGAYAIRPYPDGQKGLFLRSIWNYAKRNDPFFDLKNIHAELIIPLLESRKCYVKLHDHFFDLENGYAESIIPLFESKKGYMKRHIRYFCRGVLHTPHQDTLQRDI